MMYPLFIAALSACVVILGFSFVVQRHMAKQKRRSLPPERKEKSNPAFPPLSETESAEPRQSSTGERPIVRPGPERKEKSNPAFPPLSETESVEPRQPSTGECPIVRPCEDSLRSQLSPVSGELFSVRKPISPSTSGLRRQNTSGYLPIFQNPTSPIPRTATYATSPQELLLEYGHGMRTTFNERLGAIDLVTTHVVMNTPQEVKLAFQVGMRQTQEVLKPRGLEKAAILIDIGGLVIGRDVTTEWGQTLKKCLDQICLKAGEETYLVARYNSQVAQPAEDRLNEKVRRIQFMTAASINHFQSNIFETREEAEAFLMRMREVPCAS